MKNKVSDMDLISVVVPVYNVAEYLERCVGSLIAQTYKPLEIILIDDGATDNSGKICDSFEKKYPEIIKVIHQENRGLSGARNTGIAYAHGKYITFVDSDDWIALDMIENMYKNIKNSDAQISGVSFYQAYEDGRLVRNSSKKEIEVMDRKQALGSFMFNGNLTVCVWGKLYLTALWNTVKCPEGKLFEDQYTTYKLIAQAETVVFDPNPRYYYFKRQGSIGHSSFTEKTYELYWGIQEQYEYITKNYPELFSNMVVAKITWELVFLNIMFCAEKNDDELVAKTRRFIRTHLKDVLKCCEINAVRKVQISLFAYWLWGYKKVYFRYKKWKGIA